MLALLQSNIAESYFSQESIPEEQAGTQNIITIAYETGWRRVMMHYSADGQGSASTDIVLNLCVR